MERFWCCVSLGVRRNFGARKEPPKQPSNPLYGDPRLASRGFSIGDKLVHEIELPLAGYLYRNKARISPRPAIPLIQHFQIIDLDITRLSVEVDFVPIIA